MFLAPMLQNLMQCNDKKLGKSIIKVSFDIIARAAIRERKISFEIISSRQKFAKNYAGVYVAADTGSTERYARYVS